MKKEEVLRRFGLTDKEISVFLASLELGQTTVNEIARKSNTFRTYCYDILKSLMEKGLVRYFIRSGVKYYETVEPEKLIDILQETEDQIKSILPELSSIRGSTTKKPGVQFYEGKEGIKTIHEDIIKNKPEEVLVYGNTGKHYEVMEWYFPRYIRERVKNKIKARVMKAREIQKDRFKKLGKKITLIGDDIFVTDIKRIQKGINEKVANAVLIKLNQIGTLTETIEAIYLAKKNNYQVSVSHRSGETADTFIADLAVAIGCGMIKAGAPCRGERLAKYNCLLAIESQF